MKNVPDETMQEVIRRACRNNPALEGIWENYHEFIKHYAISQSTVGFFLLDKEFAKALFGEQWEKRLQELVVQDDIFKYLENYLSLS